MAKPVFDVSRFNTLIRTSHLGRKLLYSEVTGSTMDDARKMAHDMSEHPHGTVVMSESQTKARGARDHKWDASNLGNIYVSFILHLPPHSKTFEGVFTLEVAACLAVLKVVQALGVKGAVSKWPNDIWVRGHKLAGFLAEDGKMDLPAGKSLMILGVGINVNSDIGHSPDLHSIATSLMCEKGGEPVDREQFFADVCLSLEETLSQPRHVNHQVFTQHNLFQRNCDISVTSTEGKVFDAVFLEICSSWEVKFQDKRSQEELQGRSDQYTIRPKVAARLLVVFTGAGEIPLAKQVAEWLMAVVDTSQLTVCLVPESTLSGRGDWAKSCSLLVLPECPMQPQSLSDGLRAYLRAGGRLMASGLAASFVAGLLDIPVKEVLLESSSLNPELGMVHLEVQPHTSENNGVEDSEEAHSIPLLFPSNNVCYQFFPTNDPIETKDIQTSLIPASAGEGTKTKIIARYASESRSVGLVTCPVFDNAKLALWGFDLGVPYPATKEPPSDSKGKEEIAEVGRGKFDRDSLLRQVLEELLSKNVH